MSAAALQCDKVAITKQPIITVKPYNSAHIINRCSRCSAFYTNRACSGVINSSICRSAMLSLDLVCVLLSRWVRAVWSYCSNGSQRVSLLT
ncbi:hypothetical protein CLV88_10974 [Shimia abyssi]|uniref:Uncharacterized protein n=1 Tax=Shimia abyssi TaxID=1662395 RepID=A0A2P8FAE8_9RHOB|nr:hypothetical protein CLV88_10974 [Shimia abyssi]